VGTMFAESTATVAPVDFRRPSRIGRDAVAVLEATHDTFARHIATAWSAGSHAVIEVEHVSTDQLSIDDFARSLPHPTALASIHVDVMDTTALLQIDLPFALLFVERLLGGPGDASTAPAVRHPTDLEVALITHELFGPGVTAVDASLGELGSGTSQLTAFEVTPQPLQLGTPGDPLLLLTYRAEVRGDLAGQGLVTLAYPVAPLMAHLDTLAVEEMDDRDDATTFRAVTEAVLDAPLELCVRLGASPLPAAVVAGLVPGDVLRLDHLATRPADLVLEGQVVGSAHLGRRGRKVAVQVEHPPAAPRT